MTGSRDVALGVARYHSHSSFSVTVAQVEARRWKDFLDKYAF